MEKPSIMRDFAYVDVLCYMIFHDACAMEGTKLSADVKANCKNTGSVGAYMSALNKFQAVIAEKTDTDDDGYSILQYAFINFAGTVYSIVRELTDKEGVYEYVFKKNNEIINRFTPQAITVTEEVNAAQPPPPPADEQTGYDNFLASITPLLPNM